MKTEKFDIVIVGGGPGGYVAAIRAAQLGLHAALVEREHLGGVCLNWGCIPTKALLRSAEVFEHLRHAADFGLRANELSFDLDKIVQRSRGIASQLNEGVRHLLKKNKVKIFDARGRVAGPGKLELDLPDGGKVELTAGHIVLATGARARTTAPIEPDGKLVWTYKQAMTPDRMPKSLLVLGSGAIGIEFASFYRSLGAEVHIVEMQDRVLPIEDEEISVLARKAFEKQGMRVHVATTATMLVRHADSVTVTLESKNKTWNLNVDRVISAIGIVGNVEDLGLDTTRVKVDKSHIVTDVWCRTDEPGVYAIGDVAGAPWLAHKASHEGVLCVEKIAGLPNLHPLDKSRIPACTYCRPQIASMGLTEHAARSKGHAVNVGRFPFVGNGKAVALGEAEGLVKTIYDAATGELLGAHMIGAEVTELIHGFAIAKTLEATEADLMHTVFPHPTLSEMINEATLNAYGRAIHI